MIWSSRLSKLKPVYFGHWQASKNVRGSRFHAMEQCWTSILKTDTIYTRGTSVCMCSK